MWRDYLKVTGGVARPDKCAWLLINFKWVNGKCRYKRICDHFAQLQLDDADGNEIPLEHIEPDFGVKGLGVRLHCRPYTLESSRHYDIRSPLPVSRWMNASTWTYLHTPLAYQNAVFSPRYHLPSATHPYVYMVSLWHLYIINKVLPIRLN